MMIHDFLVQCNVAARHSNLEYLVKLVCHVAENPKFYADPKNKVGLAKEKYTKLRLNHFSRFIQFVSGIVSNTRSFLMSTTGSTDTIPFLYVLHDGWDSKDNDILGCSIQFADYDTGKVVTLAAGLQRTPSKKAREGADHIERMLYRYGIMLKDIFRSVNDTASTAKKVAELIAQK